MRNRGLLLNPNKYRECRHNKQLQNILALNSRLVALGHLVHRYKSTSMYKKPLLQFKSHLVHDGFHALSFSSVGHSSNGRSGIFRHVRGITGLGEDASYGRVREDVLQ